MHKDKAIEYKSLGLNPVPIGNDKIPIRKGWGKEIKDKEINDYAWDNIGICTGAVSFGLEALDFDLKYYDEGELLMKKFQNKVGAGIINKLVIQKTQSGGYHMIYRCDVLEPNRVLAKNKKGEPIIETRGEGGYIKCAPSRGYTLFLGDFNNIPIITALERNKLFSVAHLLDEEVFVKYRGKIKDDVHFDKFPEYNSDPQIGIDLLEANDWSFAKEEDGWYQLTRPGKSYGVSAGYHMEGKFLYVHSTSTMFKDKQPYNNHDLYAMLECGGDYKMAYAKLYEQGHGVEEEGESKGGEQNQDSFETSLTTLSFLSDPKEEEQYLRDAANDKIEQGLKTGWDALDPYFRLKQNSLNFGIGYDGVGKSFMMTSLMAASFVEHNWKWGVIAPENKAAMNRRRFMECMSGMSISHLGKNEKIYSKYKKLASDNLFIASNKRHYSIKEALDMGKRMYEYHGISALLIDPFNFFKTTGTNAYADNNKILSEMRVFVEKYCTIFVMAHPVSNAARNNKDADGYLTPPTAYDIEGGASFPYRTDNFFCIHRVKNHQDKVMKRTMQWISYKIKEEETGGRVHDKDDYTALEWKVSNNFLGYWDKEGNNPMYKYKMNQLK